MRTLVSTNLRSVTPLALLVASIGLSTLGAAQPAAATEKVSYNYASTSYFKSDDLDGVSILASGEATKKIRLTVDYRYSKVDEDFAGVDVTTHAAFAGVGYVFRQLDWADFIVDAGGYFARVSIDTSLNDTDLDDGGAFTSVRARILPANRFEVEPYVRYFHTLEGNGDGFDFGLEGRFYFTENLAVHGSVEESDFHNETVFGLGIRFGAQNERRPF